MCNHGDRRRRVVRRLGGLLLVAGMGYAAIAAAMALAAEPARPMSHAEKAAKNPASAPGTNPAGTIAAYEMKLKDAPKFDKPLMFNTPEADAVLSRIQIFPANSPFNEDISKLPVAADSDAMIATMKDRRTLAYNLDMAYILVPPDQKPVNVRLTEYPGESDPGPYPVPDDAPIEGWNPAGNVPLAASQAKVEDSDRHVIVVDVGRGLLYEFWQGRKMPQGWQASNEATFDMKTNALRPDGWTSSDAAGLPIFPLTVRYDDVASGEVSHAIRFTVHHTRAAYVYPATHKASRLTDRNLPRMGERFRLKADVDISKFSPHAQAICKGLKKYGMIVADNGGDWRISVAPDPRIKGLEDLGKLKATDFEVIVPTGPNEGPRTALLGRMQVFVVDSGKLSPAEQVLAQTLQGLTASEKARKIWIKGGGLYAIQLDRMITEGATVREVASVWDLVREFRPLVKGGIVFRMKTDSLNVAASLCGPKRGVAIEESLLKQAEAEGLPVLMDVRGMTNKDAFEKFKSLFTRGMVVDQSVGAPVHLRDLAVARNLFVFGDCDAEFRTRVVRELGPTTVVYGWGSDAPPAPDKFQGTDEFQWVRQISSGNGTAVAANWCINLSVMETLPAHIKRPADRPKKAQDGKRYVAFVMSDGDNVQVMTSGFATEKTCWGSPLRGTFPMTWEMSPALAEVSPRSLEFYYATATPNDSFVTGPGAPGYTFLHFQTDRPAIAAQAGKFLRESDLDIISTLNANEGDMSETVPLLEQPEVAGMIYKDYAPYHRRNGAIFWHKGKPCVAYRFLLWEGIQGPEDVAREVAKMPTSPQTDTGSYALINVHLWSYGKTGGPMEAVRRTIEQLPPNTEVVTANQIITMIKANFGKQHP